MNASPKLLGIPERPTNFRHEHDSHTNLIDTMAHPRSLIALLSRLTTAPIAASRVPLPTFISLPYQSIRCATTKREKAKSKKKIRNTFVQYDLKKAEQFSLVDAMQYANYQHHNTTTMLKAS